MEFKGEEREQLELCNSLGAGESFWTMLVNSLNPLQAIVRPNRGRKPLLATWLEPPRGIFCFCLGSRPKALSVCQIK